MVQYFLISGVKILLLMYFKSSAPFQCQESSSRWRDKTIRNIASSSTYSTITILILMTIILMNLFCLLLNMTRKWAITDRQHSKMLIKFTVNNKYNNKLNCYSIRESILLNKHGRMCGILSSNEVDDDYGREVDLLYSPCNIHLITFILS